MTPTALWNAIWTSAVTTIAIVGFVATLMEACEAWGAPPDVHITDGAGSIVCSAPQSTGLEVISAPLLQIGESLKLRCDDITGGPAEITTLTYLPEPESGLGVGLVALILLGRRRR